jgi:hypothetical protein
MHTTVVLLQDRPWIVLLAAWGAVGLLTIYFFFSHNRSKRLLWVPEILT